MITLVDKEKEIEIKNSFSGEINLLLLKYFKFLFIENNELYFSMSATEQSDIDILRKNYGSIKTKCMSILGVKKLKNIHIEEEKILFFQKAIEICNTKNVSITLK